MLQLNPSSVIDAPKNLKPMQAYTCLGVCYNLSFILLHFPTVAPFAPVIGLVAGCASVYFFSNGYN